MRYYAQYNASNTLIAIGTGAGGVEITEEEYNRLLTEIRERGALEDALYNGEITIESVPLEWREEIQRRVNERIAAEIEAAQQEVNGEEFMSMLEGVL